MLLLNHPLTLVLYSCWWWSWSWWRIGSGPACWCESPHRPRWACQGLLGSGGCRKARPWSWSSWWLWSSQIKYFYFQHQYVTRIVLENFTDHGMLAGLCIQFLHCKYFSRFCNALWRWRWQKVVHWIGIVGIFHNNFHFLLNWHCLEYFTKTAAAKDISCREVFSR